jgi:hypothetical protein
MTAGLDEDAVSGMTGHIAAHRDIAAALGLPWPPEPAGPELPSRRWSYPLVSFEPPPACFMDQVRITWGKRPWRDCVCLVHEPTGRRSEAVHLRDAIADLALQLVRHGEIAVSDARRALCMPEWEEDPGAVPAGPAWYPSGLAGAEDEGTPEK